MPFENDLRWSLATRIAFRFCFCYFLLYGLCCGNATLWEAIPFYGLRLEGLAAYPFNHIAQSLGQHLFHLQGAAAKLHASGFNDRALDWIACGVMLSVAILATLLWSLLDRHRQEYRTLFTWLRLGLRLTMVAGMFVYAAMKISPIQIGPASLAVLNEPVGHLSPMTLLWTTLGLSPTYEILCGVMEYLAALLLLYRRTALAGVLLSGVILSNIVLFDVFFDVPVKLYSTNLLLMTFVLAAPDIAPLLRFFWSGSAAKKTEGWAPTLRGRKRIALLVFEAAFVIVLGILLPIQKHKTYAAQLESVQHPSPLIGHWHLDQATPKPFLTGDGQPMSDLFLEPTGQITVRAVDQTLWGGGHSDFAQQRLRLMSPTRLFLSYAIQQPDATHLVLLPQDKSYPELRLTRVPLPASYPLYQRGFHLTNEWGFEQ